MAKLNKQEVNAIAGKLQRELKKLAEEDRHKAILNYSPSTSYLEIKDLLTQRDELNQQITALEKLRDTVIDTAKTKLREIYGIWWSFNTLSISDICNTIISRECQLKEVPEIDELKENVTIAAIDDNFNTVSFIEEQLAKYK